MNKLSIKQAIFTDESSIIDTHVHYNMAPFSKDWLGYWQRANNHGVAQSVIPGVDLESSIRAVKIAEQDKHLWALVGVHPSEVTATEDWESVVIPLRDMLKQPTVLGVGEVGLDYFRLRSNDFDSRRRQRWWLRQQLQLAYEHGGWISLHVRDQQQPSSPQPDNAYWDAWEIVKEFNWDVKRHHLIMHCLSGSPEYVQAMLELGAYAGFDGNLTYPQSLQLRRLWSLVPPERRLLETDAPYLPPQPYRGQVCEPWMIVETAKYAKQL